MKFSRAVFLSAALCAASAAAFSIPTATSAPKTALYASSHDEGVLERRQVLASLAATTAVTLGASVASAVTGSDVKQGAKDAADAVRSKTDSIANNNMGGMGGMGRNMDMTKNVAQNIGKNDPVDAAKNAANSVNFPNPFSGDAGSKANDVANQARDRGRDIARKGRDVAENATDKAQSGFQGNKNPINTAKSMSNTGNMGNNNPFSGGMNQGNNMNPFDNKNMMNKDNNPMTNKNPMNRSGLSNNMPNMPNSPGDASNKLKDAGQNLFSNAQKAANTNF